MIYKTKYLEFKDVLKPSGALWHYVKRTNDKNSHDSAVIVTTVVKKDNIYNFLLLKTSRPPITAENKAKYCIECPAGLIGDENKSETLIECAKKELLEEGGYIADEMFIELTNSCTSAGLTSETLSFITAIVEDDSLKSTPISDDGIILDRIFVPTNKIYEYLSDIDNKTVSIASSALAGIFYALRRIRND